jgi:hypothetical protein
VKLPVPIRLLKDRYFGEAARSATVAKDRLADITRYLEPDAAKIAEVAVSSLITYQDPDYALLYLDRLGRYAGPKRDRCLFLAELAQRLDQRMRFDDVPSLAARVTQGGIRQDAETFYLIDLVGMLPPNTADQIVPVVDYLKWADRPVSMRFDGSRPRGMKWARSCALLKRARCYSKRAKTEHAWAERWLHMIDRTQIKQPDAAIEVVRSADLITGAGEVYHRGLRRWHSIVDHLIKPACDGLISSRDMAESVRNAVRDATSLTDSFQFDLSLANVVGEMKKNA